MMISEPKARGAEDHHDLILSGTCFSMLLATVPFSAPDQRLVPGRGQRDGLPERFAENRMDKGKGRWPADLSSTWMEGEGMQFAPWAFAVYLGIGVIWLVAMLVLARREYEWISPKEAMIHLLAWPFVFVALRLWGVAFVAAALVGLVAISAFAPDELIADVLVAVRRVSTQ